MSLSFARTCHWVTRGALFAAACLVPLMYVPWTYEPLEINKHTLFVVFVVLAAFAWLGAAIAERRMVIRGAWFLGALTAFALLPLVSSATYAQAYTSIIGASGQEYTSVVTTLLCVVLVFLVLSSFTTIKQQMWLWSGMLCASGVVAALLVPVFFGAVLPSLVGGPNATALYLLVMSFLGSGLWLTARGEKDDVLPAGMFGVLVRVSLLLTTAVALAMLLVIDYSGLWIVALVGTGALFAFALLRAEEFPHIGRFIPSMLLLVASLVFLFVPSFFANPFIPEVTLSNNAAFAIASDTLTARGVLFGSGPGTYAVDYAAYHRANLNTSDFWDVTFDRANSYALTLVPTFGLLGTVLYILVIIAVGTAVITQLARARTHAQWRMTLPPALAWLALTVAQAFFPMNMTLIVVYWCISAVLLVHSAHTVREYDFARSPRAGIASALLFMLLFVGLAMTLFVTVIRYRAEIAFAQAIAQDRAGGDLDDVITLLDRAATTNTWSDVYFRNLGYALLLRTSQLIDAGADADLIQRYIATSFNAAETATRLAGTSVVNWELRGTLYREVAPLFTDEVDAQAVAAWQKAVSLAPSNPKEYVGLARADITRADGFSVIMQGDDAAAALDAKTKRDAALREAEDALNTARTLKPDYTSAQYYLAQVYERQDKLADAVSGMETLKIAAPRDIGVAMQLGLLYLRQGKNAAAKDELLRALSITPDYANAHWYLASIYEQEGNLDAAIAEVEKVAESDPGNTLVAQRLERLRAGKAVATLPDPVDAGDEATLPSEPATAP